MKLETASKTVWFWPVYSKGDYTHLIAAFRTRALARDFARTQGMRAGQNWVEVSHVV